MTDCEKFYQIYNAKKARSVPYSELEVLLNIDVLSVVGKLYDNLMGPQRTQISGQTQFWVFL